MIKVYGSKMCPDCRNLELNFKKFNIEYLYLDINSSLKNLKEFLYYRDSYPYIFDRLKSIGDIGIPCVIDCNNVFTDWEGFLINKGYTDLEYEESSVSCSIDHKNC